MAERGEESKERVSMELSDEVFKAMEVGLAFRDYVSYYYPLTSMLLPFVFVYQSSGSSSVFLVGEN